MRVDRQQASSSGHEKQKKRHTWWWKIPFAIVGRIVFPFYSCFIQIFLFSIALFVIFSILTIRSGVWYVPTVSDWLYTKDDPRARVSVASSQEVLESLSVASSEVLFGNSTSISLTNEALTVLLTSFKKPLLVEYDYLQASTNPENVEVYMEMKRPLDTLVRAYFEFEVKDATIEMKPTGLIIGDQGVPSVLLAPIFSSFLQNGVESFFDSLGPVSSVQMKEGVIVIRFGSA